MLEFLRDDDASKFEDWNSRVQKLEMHLSSATIYILKVIHLTYLSKMDVKQTEILREALISEIAAGEFRAKRSLRALQHQEGRVFTLENELSGKSNMLERLQESHSNLMEVHRYQEEVQALQRQLIKMQEIQYLTEVVQPKMEQNDNENQSTNETSQTSLQVDPKNENGELISSASQKSTLFRSLGKGDGNGSSATDNAILFQQETRSTNKFSSLKSSLGDLGGLLQQQPQPQHSMEKYSFNRCAENVRGIQDAVQDEESGAMPDEDEPNGQKLGTFDDDDEKISILRETLSSHKQSIEDLSSEVVLLRKEKSDLLCYMENLMEWKSKVENILENFGIPKNLTGNQSHMPGLAKPDSQKEIDVIKGPPPPAVPSGKRVQKNLSSLSLLSVSTTGAESDDNDNSVRKVCGSKNVGWKLSSKSSAEDRGDAKDENENMDADSRSKLEKRATRMWDTACRFFTPQQAHFILTAPTPHEFEEANNNDSWLTAFAEGRTCY